MNNITNTKEIETIARANSKERTALINAARKMIIEDNDNGLAEMINEIDPSFVRKLMHFSGDLTSHRIAKVFAKINEQMCD